MSRTYKDGTVDRLGGQIAFERLVDGDTVNVGVVHKPDDLVAEKFRVVLRVQVWLGRLGRVELKTLADTLSENKKGGVGLHDLGKSLLDERFHSLDHSVSLGLDMTQ